MRLKTLPLIPLLCLALLRVGVIARSSVDSAASDDWTVGRIAELLMRLDGSVWTQVGEEVERRRWTPDDVEALSSIRTPDGSADGSDECELCKTGLGALMTLVKDGKTYEDLKNLSLIVCRPIVRSAGYNADILCEMVLDVYGPHVVYILNVTTKSSLEICTIYHYCDYKDNKIIKVNVNSYDRSGEDININIDKSERENLDRKSTFSRFARAVDVEKIATKFKDQKQEAMQILHISDTHPDDFYAAGYPSTCDMPLCCRADSNGNGTARYWGDYGCNTPQRTISYMFDFISKNLQPDLILYTGDTPMHTVYNQTVESTVHSFEWLTEQLVNYFPGVPAYPTFGNHDTCPTNLYYPNITESQELNKNFYELWRNLSRFDSTNRETIEEGGYFSARVFPGLRVISINSNFVYLENYYCILNMDEDPFQKMKNFLENSLIEAAAYRELVIIINHQPSGGDDFVDGYDDFVNEMRLKYSDTIFLNLAGHSHHDSFSMIRDEFEKAKGIQLTAPSMTTYRDVNPSFRIIYAARSPALQLLDLETYRLDIAEDGNSEYPRVFKAYSFREDYEMKDLTYTDFDELIYRMSINETIFDFYRYNYASGRPITACDPACTLETLCSLAYASYDARQQCNQS